MTCPCKDCTARRLGCHDKCVGYKTWKAEHDKEAARERMNKTYSIRTGNWYKKDGYWRNKKVKYRRK